MRRMKVLVVIGTRPEAVKMSLLIRELRGQAAFEVSVCSTGQHREMLNDVFATFDIHPDVELHLMKEGRTLSAMTALFLTEVERVIQEFQPEWVLVQGDTTTAMVAALAAYYQRVKVGHIEAGLRTYEKYAPYPEEFNRRVISLIADAHFVPTQEAYTALLKEHVLEKNMLLTGNTVVDALEWTKQRNRSVPPERPLSLPRFEKPMVIVTCHRRENFGDGLQQVCDALEVLASTEDVEIVYPVHLNPAVRTFVFERLQDKEHIHLIDPLAYAPFISLLDEAYLVLTDSGGVQEEAVALGKPVLVLRETTERQEGINAGGARLVGTTCPSIVDETRLALRHPEHYQAMAHAKNPYGDGHAVERIVGYLFTQV